MSVDAQPRWFDAQAIGTALERETAPDAAELRDILNKSLELQPLTLAETVALMRVQDGVGVGRIMAAADEVKQQVYGDRIVLPGHVLTSILKHPNKAVYEIIAAAASGHFAGKEILVRDLQNGGVDSTSMEPFKAAAGKNLPPDMDRRLRELRGEILNGGIRLKSLRERTLCDCL